MVFREIFSEYGAGILGDDIEMLEIIMMVILAIIAVFTIFITKY